ncbi:MAG TPA: hypothetical protein VK636_05090 [Gemmatimonadaceae bacterium]|nr:hypothetical protein [Gemmatimonadaceae bacterium]
MTSFRPMLAARAALGALVILGACGRDVVAPRAPVAPPTTSFSRDGRQPDFLEPAPGAPTIANPTIAFWAVKGRDVRVKMVYHQRPGGGGNDSVVFAELRVRARSLALRPDGSPITNGDSVFITMTLVDPTRGILDFQPSGLRFSRKDPPSLKISFEHANLDLNGDGRVDDLDRVIERTFHIAVRESPADPWVPLRSAVNTHDFEIEATIQGFSGYAIDY